MEASFHAHGGDLDAIEAKYGISKDEIVDFSGNVNPLGFPPATAQALAQNIAIVSRYPDKKYRKLRASIAAYTGADMENVAVGNGSTELISAFIAAIHPRHTIIMGPAYSEYENNVSLCGGAFEYFPLREKDDFRLDLPALIHAVQPDTDMLILCNPNNPTGTAIPTAQLRKLLEHCRSTHTALMVDETYIEFADDPKAFCAIPLTNEFPELFVIRGISKFYAAPGLRLGYGICSNPDFKEELAQKQDPWSVNILAAFAGERLFEEKEFMARTRALILGERRRLLAELSGWKSIRVYPTASNFILLRLLTDQVRADTLTEDLIHKKMLIRDAASFTFLDESYLRFCIQLPEQNSALLRELARHLGETFA